MIIFSMIVSAQYRIPNDAQAQLITQSSSLNEAKLIANNTCNVFVFKDNVFFSISGLLQDSTTVSGYPNLKPIQQLIVLKDHVVMLQGKRIISITTDSGHINAKKKTTVLSKLKTTDVSIFPGMSEDHFFIITHKFNNRNKREISVVQSYTLGKRTSEPMFEVDGRVNWISGNQSSLCLAVGKELILVNDKKEYILASEDSEITCVVTTPIGIFFSTYSNVYFMLTSGEKIVIVEKGAYQLIDNCNTLYMILTDGSLIRIHNTLAFAEFYNHFKQSNNEKGKSNH